LRLFLDQHAGNPHVRVHENAESKFQVFHDALVEAFKFSRSILRKLILVLDLLASKLNQVLVDDVANMF
jgi:hypothetical protein